MYVPGIFGEAVLSKTNGIYGRRSQEDVRETWRYIAILARIKERRKHKANEIDGPGKRCKAVGERFRARLSPRTGGKAGSAHALQIGGGLIMLSKRETEYSPSLVTQGAIPICRV